MYIGGRVPRKPVRMEGNEKEKEKSRRTRSPSFHILIFPGENIEKFCGKRTLHTSSYQTGTSSVECSVRKEKRERNVEKKGERKGRERGLVIVGGTIPLTSASRRSLSSSRVTYFSRALTDATGAAIADATTTTTTTPTPAAAAANYVFRVLLA